MKVKYIRVSTIEQNTERQQVNEDDFDKIYIDKSSGSISFFDRIAGGKLISDIKDIDEVHVLSVSRLGRNILDILTVIEFFNKNNVNLYIENIGMFSMVDNKPNSIFKMIVSVLGNVSEMERLSMLERQKQGIKIAKVKGVYKGRLYGSRMTKEEFLKKYQNVVKELKKGESLRRTGKLCGCSLGTVQRVKTALAS